MNENSDEKIIQELVELLEHLQVSGRIVDLQIESKATFAEQENMVSTFTFSIPDGLTIDKYHKIITWIEKYYPIMSVKKHFHKHRIVLYYNYDR